MNTDAVLDRVRIVLCRTSHPGNIGAAARAMKTMGLHRLFLVAPHCFPDEVATTRATGAVDVLEQATVCASLDEALAGTTLAVALTARVRDLGPTALPVRAAVAELLGQARDQEVALVFGNETSGLTNDELQRCQRVVTIPANPEFSSLNLGAAVQVLAYELRMAGLGDVLSPTTVATPFASPLAAHEDVERFFAHLETVMVATGFHDPATPRRLMPKLRRLFGRAGLERDEVNILRGVLDSVDRAMLRRNEK